MLQNVEDRTKSTIIRKACPYCGALVRQKSVEVFNLKRKILLECGHTIVENLEENKEWTIKSLSGKEPFPFQYKTLDFITNSNFRTGIFHDTGVGKTICSLIAITKYPEKLMPFVVICKSSLKAQWWKEILDWTGQPAQIIHSSTEKAFPAFKAFIISYDLLRNGNPFKDIGIKLVILDECQQIKNSTAKRTQGIRNMVSGRISRKRVYNSNLEKRWRIQAIAEDLMRYHGVFSNFELNFEQLDEKKLGLCECHATKDGIIKGRITIAKQHAEHDDESKVIETILHEIAHAITPGAGHKKIWSDTSIAIGGNGLAQASCNGSIEIQEQFEAPMFVMALSGTPIKNHAGEYFPVLNILHPEIFMSQAAFERDFCDTYSSSYGGYKIGGLRRHATERFHDLTKDWIIRYERQEVLPDLPKIFRKNFFVELGAEVEKAYRVAFIDFQQAFLEGSNNFSDQGNLLAKLNRMRHLTGIAKVLPVTEFVEEFLEDNDRKLCLFVHHKDVGLGLLNNLTEVTKRLRLDDPLSLTSENASSDQGQRIDEQWKSDPRKRIMVASTLSAGEGKNWQMCSDAIIVERQWNPANEEQAEGRFPRPGAIAESISITYALALGTPDEYLAEIVERKREICKKTMGNESIVWDQTSVIREMSELLMSKGAKRWNL